MFGKLDADHDGKITIAEARAAHPVRTTATKARHGLPSLFRLADANKDHAITRAEFDAAVDSGRIKSRHARMRGNQIARLFDKGDANGDGRLSLEEARATAQQRFDSADANHDGVLTPDERRQASKAERVRRHAAG